MAEKFAEYESECATVNAEMISKIKHETSAFIRTMVKEAAVNRKAVI